MNCILSFTITLLFNIIPRNLLEHNVNLLQSLTSQTLSSPQPHFLPLPSQRPQAFMVNLGLQRLPSSWTTPLCSICLEHTSLRSPCNHFHAEALPYPSIVCSLSCYSHHRTDKLRALFVIVYIFVFSLPQQYLKPPHSDISSTKCLHIVSAS